MAQPKRAASSTPQKPCPDGTFGSCVFSDDYPSSTASQIDRARNEANRTPAHFNILIGVLLGLAAIVAALTVGIAAATGGIGVVFAAVLVALGVAISALIAQATAVGALFSNEATNDRSWWSVSHVGTDFANQVAIAVGSFSVAYESGAILVAALPASLGLASAGLLGAAVYSQMAMSGVAAQANDLVE